MLLHATITVLSVAVCSCVGCETVQPGAMAPPPAIESSPSVPRPPFVFSPEDESLLDEIELGAFNFLWKAADPSTGLVPDRNSKPEVASIAGVGFALSALPVGVERGWISRNQGADRAMLILSSLSRHPEIQKAGFFQHFLNASDATLHRSELEHVVSTIDSALLFCGVLTASQYFQGEVRVAADRLFQNADFRFFVNDKEPEEWKRGFVSLGWKPDSLKDAAGSGRILPYYWLDSGCEHRLVTLLGVCAPLESHRLDPATYYRLRRTLGTYNDIGPVVWFPYSGALFVNQFSHCWVNYAAKGLDDPAAFGYPSDRRVRVDWWENSRRMVRLHREKAIENPRKLPTLGENAWGLSASDCPAGYCVPGVFPNAAPMPGARPKLDYATEHPKDNFGDGTIAPYAAATSVMFEPRLAIDALRYYRSLKVGGASSSLWSDPRAGGYGFADAFNLGDSWIAPDYVAIDQGPMLLAIENARTGLIWRTFEAHPWVVAGLQRLRLISGPAAK